MEKIDNSYIDDEDEDQKIVEEEKEEKSTEEEDEDSEVDEKVSESREKQTDLDRFIFEGMEEEEEARKYEMNKVEIGGLIERQLEDDDEEEKPNATFMMPKIVPTLNSAGSSEENSTKFQRGPARRARPIRIFWNLHSFPIPADLGLLNTMNAILISHPLILRSSSSATFRLYQPHIRERCILRTIGPPCHPTTLQLCSGKKRCDNLDKYITTDAINFAFAYRDQSPIVVFVVDDEDFTITSSRLRNFGVDTVFILRHDMITKMRSHASVAVCWDVKVGDAPEKDIVQDIVTSDSRIHWQLQPMRFHSHDVAASGLLDGCSRRCEVAILWDGMNLSFILYSHYIYQATNRNNNNNNRREYFHA